MRKPSKPRGMVEPTLTSVANRLAKEQVLHFKKSPTLLAIMEKLPGYARDPSKITIVRADSRNYYGYNSAGPLDIRVKVSPKPEVVEAALKAAKKRYKDALPNYEEKWKAYEAKLMEWKEWKYSKVMKEINEA